MCERAESGRAIRNAVAGLTLAVASFAPALPDDAPAPRQPKARAARPARRRTVSVA
jgi:hypothetical protein